MGAFFIYKKNKKLDIAAVKEIFKKKGFCMPNVFQFGDIELLLYKKQLVDCNNWIQDGDMFICVIGTIIYEGNGYQKTKERLLEDFKQNSIKLDKLRGNFCILFAEKNNIKVVNDGMNVQHLFTNKNHDFISSSFLAAMSAIPGKVTLNRQACIEKFLTGYTVGQDTLINEVIHITRNLQRRFKDWDFIRWPQISIPKPDGMNRIKNARNRAENIRQYLRDIFNLAEETSPEIGLSNGYDSRTIYAGVLDVWNKKIAIHTHATEGAGAHDEEKVIVKEIANHFGAELTIIPTKSMDSYSEEEIENILKDGLYFFDGRCSYNMGAFSPVYTRRYKIATLGRHKLTLNGLGGEMYRNYYMVSKPFIGIRQWMKAHTYCVAVDDVIDKKTFHKLHENLTKKIGDELGFKWHRYTTNFRMRRYYSEVVMPDCDALNCNAHNQLAFYLTPFIEREMIMDAYRSRQAIGISGELQAEIIRVLNEYIARFDSHYGFPFSNKEPLKYKLYMLIRGWLPDIIWNARNKYIIRKKNNKELTYFKRTVAKCEYLKKAAEFAEKLFPEINYANLRRDYAMMPNSSYTSVFLYEFQQKIDTEKN